MKILTSAIVAGMLIASPLAAQKIGDVSDSVVVAPNDGQLVGGSLSSGAIGALAGLAVLALIAAGGGGDGSSTTTTAPVSN